MEKVRVYLDDGINFDLDPTWYDELVIFNRSSSKTLPYSITDFGPARVEVSVGPAISFETRFSQAGGYPSPWYTWSTTTLPVTLNSKVTFNNRGFLEAGFFYGPLWQGFSQKDDWVYLPVVDIVTEKTVFTKGHTFGLEAATGYNFKIGYQDDLYLRAVYSQKYFSLPGYRLSNSGLGLGLGLNLYLGKGSLFIEFGLGRGEHFLAQLDVVVHRAADVEKQQHLDLVVALGPHQDVEHPGFSCG